MWLRLDPVTESIGAQDSTSGPSDLRAEVQRSSPRRRQWVPGVLCRVIYGILASLAFGHFNAMGPTHMSGNGSQDAIVQIWWLEWIAHAIAHTGGIFSTQCLKYPAGANFGVNGSMFALGVVLLPITKVFGPVVAWNVIRELRDVTRYRKTQVEART